MLGYAQSDKPGKKFIPSALNYAIIVNKLLQSFTYSQSGDENNYYDLNKNNQSGNVQDQSKFVVFTGHSLGGMFFLHMFICAMS